MLLSRRRRAAKTRRRPVHQRPLPRPTEPFTPLTRRSCPFPPETASRASSAAAGGDATTAQSQTSKAGSVHAACVAVPARGSLPCEAPDRTSPACNEAWRRYRGCNRTAAKSGHARQYPRTGQDPTPSQGSRCSRCDGRPHSMLVSASATPDVRSLPHRRQSAAPDP